jgi:cytochrome b561
MARRDGYSGLQIGLHWATAFFVFAAFFSHDQMEDALESSLEGAATGTPTHVYFGLAALAVVLVRLGVRFTQGAPGPVEGTSPAMAQAAIWGHRLLYLLMLAVPIGGAVTWFGGLENVGDVHEIAGKALVIVAVAHAVVAMMHEALAGDGVLMRMFRPRP